MNNDEHIAFAYLKKNRDLHQPIIATYKGRWIKELGDGVMASFNTVSDAVNAAVKTQEACHAAQDYQLRIGIHSGEVVFENDDVFGDGVNIAARIQSACEPGCIFISEAVHRNIFNKKDTQSQFVKEAKLKNVDQPVRLYQVLYEGGITIAAESASIPSAAEAENSIAVLPFANMSNDPDQEFFSDGISEEIINVLDIVIIAASVGSYPLDENDGGADFRNFLDALHYSTTDNISGILTITSITDTRVKGTFSFDAENVESAGDVIEVRGGEFDVEFF